MISFKQTFGLFLLVVASVNADKTRILRGKPVTVAGGGTVLPAAAILAAKKSSMGGMGAKKFASFGPVVAKIPTIVDPALPIPPVPPTTGGVSVIGVRLPGSMMGSMGRMGSMSFMFGGMMGGRPFPFPFPFPKPFPPGVVPPGSLVPLPMVPAPAPAPAPVPAPAPAPAPAPGVPMDPGTAPEVIQLPLLEIIRMNAPVNLTAAAIEAAGLADAVATGPITILVPSNAAVEAIGAAAVTADVLLGHVIAEPFDLELLRAGMTFTTLAGTTIALDLTSQDLALIVSDAAGNPFARVGLVQNDVFGANGVIHVIDGVIPPVPVALP